MMSSSILATIAARKVSSSYDGSWAQWGTQIETPIEI